MRTTARYMRRTMNTRRTSSTGRTIDWGKHAAVEGRLRIQA